MRTRKLAVMTLVALLGSDLALPLRPVLGQTSGTGNGQPLTPSLGGSDGTYGRVLPGPSTTAPYATPQPLPSTLPSVQPQPQMVQRPVGPSPLNVCQPGGTVRPYQTVSIPRARPAEPLGPARPAPTTTVTQITVSQSVPGAPSQTSPPPAEPRAPGAEAPQALTEVDEFSRIEAGFNLDPIWLRQGTPLLLPQAATPQSLPQ